MNTKKTVSLVSVIGVLFVAALLVFYAQIPDKGKEEAQPVAAESFEPEAVQDTPEEEPAPVEEVAAVEEPAPVEEAAPVVEEEAPAQEYYYEPEYSEPAYQAPAYQESYGDCLTRSGGVYYNQESGCTETYYSSNVLYHYRTPEWTPDANGVYRDSDGYVVVASSDLAQGETVETSHGTGKVYDSGCASGIVDLYVTW